MRKIGFAALAAGVLLALGATGCAQQTYEAPDTAYTYIEELATPTIDEVQQNQEEDQIIYNQPVLSEEEGEFRMQRNVYVLVLNPYVPSEDADIISLMGWNDPMELTAQYISDVREASGGELEYIVTHVKTVDKVPVKADGHQYSGDEYYSIVKTNGQGSHQPDGVDYVALMEEHGIVELANSGDIDELWVMGGPWFGFWESFLPGPGSFYYNSPAFEYDKLNTLLPIMGFNYQRDVACMLEDLGHRTESTMTHIHGGWDVNQERHDWDKYAHNFGQTSEVSHYQVGSIHYPFNGEQDYDFSNPRQVVSNADAWLEYPNMPEGKERIMDCSEWGCTHRGYMNWWFAHLPRAEGKTDEVLNNWWAYVLEPELARDTAEQLRAAGR